MLRPQAVDVAADAHRRRRLRRRDGEMAHEVRVAADLREMRDVDGHRAAAGHLDGRARLPGRHHRDAHRPQPRHFPAPPPPVGGGAGGVPEVVGKQIPPRVQRLVGEEPAAVMRPPRVVVAGDEGDAALQQGQDLDEAVEAPGGVAEVPDLVVRGDQVVPVVHEIAVMVLDGRPPAAAETEDPPVAEVGVRCPPPHGSPPPWARGRRRLRHCRRRHRCPLRRPGSSGPRRPP